MTYLAQLREGGASPATRNGRLAALNAVVDRARFLGCCGWAIEVPYAKVRRGREVRGPALAAIHVMLDACDAATPRGARDGLIVWLLYGLGLRREEASTLDLEHVERDKEGRPVALWVLGKQREERERLALPEPVREALSAWLIHRGDAAGPLIRNLDRARKGTGRLTGHGVWRAVTVLGRRCGIAGVRPHGFRHAAITAALDATNGDVRKVQQFSRHADPRTVMLYDDARHDYQGEVASLVVARLR